MTNKKKIVPAGPASHTEEIQVVQVKRARVTFCVLGLEPMLFNSMNAKAKRELLLPSVKKNKNEKSTTLKHDPYAEFRASVYSDRNDKAPTLLTMPSTAFKSALRNAAVDIPGSATKASIGRLTYVEGDFVHVYGVPKLHMAVVRMADMARTPDVRTRACLPEWACKVTVSFVRPILNETVVTNLLAGAGLMQGVGDFRTEKGKGNFGSFELVNEDDERFQRIVAEGGRAPQVEAMESPECYDGDAAELLSWFTSEAKRREFKIDMAEVS